MMDELIHSIGGGRKRVVEKAIIVVVVNTKSKMITRKRRINLKRTNGQFYAIHPIQQQKQRGDYDNIN